MNLKPKPNKTEKALYFFLLTVLLASLIIAYKKPIFFNTIFAIEDGIIEWLTVIFLFLCTTSLCIKAINLWSSKFIFWKTGIISLILLFFFAFGEEISWGQRVFNLQPNDFFIQQNLQKEINLHNLIIGNVSINKLVFSQLIFVVLLIYLLILPTAYQQNKSIKKLINSWAIPIVNWHHILAYVLSSLIVIAIPLDRKWEVYEFCFAFIFFMIFLNPKNSCIYEK